MIRKILTLLFIICNSSFVFANAQKYTISVCVTSNLENALFCKKRILESMSGEVLIVKNKNRYFTYLNVYDDKKIANQTIKNSSSYVKQQKPYVKELEEKILKLKENNKKVYIDLEDSVIQEEIVETIIPKENEVTVPLKKVEEFPLVSAVPNTQELKLVSSYPFDEGKRFVDDEDVEEKIEIKEEVVPLAKENSSIEEKENDEKIASYEEELRQISMDEFDRANEQLEKKEKVQKITKSYEKPKVIKKEIPKKEEIKPIVVKEVEEDIEANIADYQQLIIEVNSVTNYMTVKAQIDNHLKEIKTYRVSTGKDDVKKPFGVGKISQISLNPVWYPTADTLKTFRKRGINLPSVVPPGHKYNYMGAAKINLTHIVDGKSTYRIHGTLNEKTIGTNESAGCIRMKNSDVLQLATLINDFANMNSLDKVKVVLK
ncbi:L,D-transpeptidase [Arcobacter ellisii]|uniref:L,D-transpeptidase n=1 Tax=Arcobacter ellisii TaxID=913109 RepID=A0A347U5K5_9BACT|nr:L,D-transpeptidase [Arcobacter ellisii]AXX94133.1 putative lipoprotein-anchoring transpeptidase, ErfK/SrfK family [Arcobacter ellisii]RXI32491.1 L,D-transpeptidase [Arcobacter ellisii]